ncbi:MAG: ABC transporter permease subunit, partial [Hassallia sp.]
MNRVRVCSRVVDWLRLSLVVSLSCLLLVLGGCSFNNDVSYGGKTLKVANEPAFPPFEFKGEGGKSQGFSIDLMNAIALAANFKVEWQSLPFDGIIPALQAQTVDAAISSFTITQERAKTVSFSRPYFKAGLAIAIRDNNKDITSFESLKNKKIAVQISTTGGIKAKEITGAKIRTFDSAPSVLQELANGNVDAVIHDAPVILYAINKGNIKGIKVVSELLTEEYYGIPTPKNSPNLKLINDGLDRVLQNGTYSQIYQKWFKVQPPALPLKLPFQNEISASGSGRLGSISVVLQYFPILLQGALVTLQLTVFSVVLGLIGGSLIGIIRLSHITLVRWSARAYVDFFRGTPMLVQIFMIYFGLPAIAQELGFPLNFNRLAAAVMALSLNSAAYIAEIVRAGIQSIEIGQSEAAQSLG